MDEVKEKLPNEILIIVLGIFGYLCCCFLGFGLIPSAAAFFLARSSEKLYAANPEVYENVSQIKTGKIIAIIAIVLNLLYIIRIVYVIATGDWEASMQQSRELMEQWGLDVE